MSNNKNLVAKNRMEWMRMRRFFMRSNKTKTNNKKMKIMRMSSINLTCNRMMTANQKRSYSKATLNRIYYIDFLNSKEALFEEHLV